MVRDEEGNWVEPNIYDLEIDETELTPGQIVGNWICMGAVMGCVIILLPFFGLCLFILTRGNNAQVASPSVKSSLPTLRRTED